MYLHRVLAPSSNGRPFETLFIGQNRGWDSPWVRGNLEKGLLSRLGITITPRWQKGYFRFCFRKARM